MTITQIETVINEIGGYSLNTMISLSEVSSINLSTDSNLYPEPDAVNFYFKSDDDVNLLLVYELKENSDGELEPCEHPITAVSIDAITGFTLKNRYHTEAPYRYGKMV